MTTALRRGQAGFTLLELIIALATMVLIGGVLVGVLRLGSRAWERGEREVDIQQRNRDLVALLTGELRSAYPYQLKEGEKRVYWFQGERSRVRFVSALSDPSPAGQAPLRMVTFSFGRGQGLSVQSAPLLGGGLPEEHGGTAQLSDSRVEDFRLRYLGPDGWVASWEPKEVKPQAQKGPGQVAAGGAMPGGTDYPLPRAVEITLMLAQSKLGGPIAVPVFAAVELRRSNPAGGGGS